MSLEALADVYVLPLVDPNNTSAYAVAGRLAVSTAASGLAVLAILLLWRQISWYREPQWVKNAPTVPSPNLWSRIQGTTIEFVQQGKICRTFMHPDQPDVLRLNNGVAGGMFRDFIFVKDPKIAREVMEEPNTRKPERGYRAFRRLTGYKGSPDFLSSVSHKDDLYSRTRVKSYEILMRRCLENYDTQFVETVDRFVDRIAKSSTFAVVDEMHLIATSLITRIAFNEDSEEFDRNLFESAVWIINDMINRPMNCSLTFMDDLPTPTNWQLKRRQKTLVDTIETMIQHKKDAPGDDLISELLKDPANTDNDLLGILSIFFFAGFDTTSNTMSMCLYHLANNPEVQERCRRDVFDVLGKEGKPVMSKIFHMQYLIAVIKETLRMFPTVPMVTREVTDHHPDGVCPRFNEPSTFGVTLNFFGLHYNPAAWNKPEEFLPERWLDPSIDADRDATQRLYCPFAIGKRSCLGRQFAYIEMLTVIASILQKFRVFPKKGAPDVKISEGGTLVVDHDMELGLEPYVEAKAMSAMLKATEKHKNEKSYSVEEVAKHHTKNDLWMILDNGVYDITEYVAGEQGGHPGGVEILVAYGGTDATAEFDFIVHPNYARRMLSRYRIGKVADTHNLLQKEDLERHILGDDVVRARRRTTLPVANTSKEDPAPMRNYK